MYIKTHVPNILDYEPKSDKVRSKWRASDEKPFRSTWYGFAQIKAFEQNKK